MLVVSGDENPCRLIPTNAEEIYPAGESYTRTATIAIVHSLSSPSLSSSNPLGRRVLLI
jgi:hypothetical protein